MLRWPQAFWTISKNYVATLVRDVSHELLRMIQGVPKAKLAYCLERHHKYANPEMQEAQRFSMGFLNL